MKKSTQACLHELFEEKADLQPDSPAIFCDDIRLTYQEVEQKANQLAHHLQTLGVGWGKFVGLYLDRSELPIIASLAIMKAGAAYVPIDPSFPSERVRHILEHSNVEVLVTEKAFEEKASTIFSNTIVLLDEHAPRIDKQPISRLCDQVQPNDLCYVMYTSGTTGKPKGVMTQHGNVVSFLSAFNEVCGLTPEDRLFFGFSIGFDGSIEEIWMAFSNGASLVVGAKEVVGLGAEAARVMTKHRVTFFSTVPTFLSMIKEDLPTVRLLVVSGEKCPKDLIQQWATPNRRMLNVYGPTETTVNATAAVCSPDKPVTIGKPLPGYDLYVLDEKKKTVSPHEIGELYIGGPGVARGYLNMPEHTKNYFIPNPFNGEAAHSRLYRTGDLVRWNQDMELEFLGRADSQVKIRGFRIELSEIETVLRQYPDIHAASVNVAERNGLKDLAAYVVLSQNISSLDRDDLLCHLNSHLPKHMVPAYLEVLPALPTLSSGKIDRKKLPDPQSPLVRSERAIVAPANEWEEKIKGVWEQVLKIAPISVEDDFFTDLRGYSLLAAQMASLLRQELDTDINIRDVYQNPTIRQLANIASSAKKQNPVVEEKPRFESLSPMTRSVCVGLQALSLVLIYGLPAAAAMLVIFMIIGVVQGTFALTSCLWILGGLGLLGYPVFLGLSILFKWLVIGRYKPGQYPVWGFYYFRWWLVSKVQMMSGASFLAGTPLMVLYYRLMGAHVGSGCVLDTGHCANFDGLRIGKNTCIGSETHLNGCSIEAGMLKIGTVTIGERCFIGMHSNLGLDVIMEDGACLDDLSMLPDNATIPEGQTHCGSPSKPGTVELPGTESIKRNPILYGALHWLALYGLGIGLLLASIPSLSILYLAYRIDSLTVWVCFLLLTIPLYELSFCMVAALIKFVVLRRTRTGTFSVNSVYYVRKWTVDTLMSMSRYVILPIYTTLYSIPWFRLMGAKLGKRVELSIVNLLAPDLLEARESCFFADGSIVGGNRFYLGHAEIKPNVVGRRSFVGNSAVLPGGASLGNGCLLGVLSSPPHKTTDHNTEWLGAPSFLLPFRQKVEGFDDSVTYSPTKKLIAHRLLVDAMRILLPSVIEIVSLILFIFFCWLIYTYLPLVAGLSLAPVLGLGLILFSVFCVVAIKRILMGNYKPGIKPLWSKFVWYNEVVNGAYESIAAPALSPLLGTPFFAGYLRLLGCKIGKHVYLGTSLFGEFDLVRIGDYAALNNAAVIQNHLFEDRIFKMSHIDIGAGCTVGTMAVVLYDTRMSPGSALGPLSLLMKGETLSPNTRWHGIPIGKNTR